MTPTDEFAIRGQPSVGFADPPDPFSQVPALAKRLGVAPMEGTGGMGGIVLCTKAGERYDFFALISAFLDRLDEKTP